jgi:hypothetical protein
VGRIGSYREFWPFYLGEHADLRTKWLHVCGTGIGIVCQFVLLPVTRSLWWVPIGFAVGYLFAWYSHFTIEKNRPATFKHPYWSFFGDFEQFFLMLLGWMPAELARLAETGALPPTPARTVYRVAIQVFVMGWFTCIGVAWAKGMVGFDRGLLG